MRPPTRPHKPVPYYNVCRVNFLRWQWSITDGKAGPYMVSPRRALTETAAYRQATKALRSLEVQGLA